MLLLLLLVVVYDLLSTSFFGFGFAYLMSLSRRHHAAICISIFLSLAYTPVSFTTYTFL